MRTSGDYVAGSAVEHPVAPMRCCAFYSGLIRKSSEFRLVAVPESMPSANTL